MILRDYFAIKALESGAFSCEIMTLRLDDKEIKLVLSGIAKNAYALADAMLLERNKGQNK